MKIMGLKLLLIISSCIGLSFSFHFQLPCRARQTGNSVICVCDDLYCDELIDGPLKSGHYRIYTTDIEGKRFEMTEGALQDGTGYSNGFHRGRLNVTLVLDPSTQYQTIKGFGGALTDAAAYNWLNLGEGAREHFLRSYFAESGIKYNFLRMSIGASDFSTRQYTYCDDIIDPDLNCFNLTTEDYDWKMPMLERINELSKEEVNLIGSCWSPPAWMKDSGSVNYGVLLKEYYEAYATYHLKYLEAYKESGYKFWGITTTNEPSCNVSNHDHPCLGFSDADQAHWIVDNLGPMIKNSAEVGDTVILGVDDQREFLSPRVDKMVATDARVLNYLDGFALHYNVDSGTSSRVLQKVQNRYPNQFLISTEASTGVTEGPDLGNWKRALDYANDIFHDIENSVTGWIDSNLCVNETGGPSYSGSTADSPIVVANNGTEFYKNPMYYILGHFSKFVTPGSVRIKETWKTQMGVIDIAFLRPDGSYALVYLNQVINKNVLLTIPSLNKHLYTRLDRNAIKTIIIKP